MRNRIRRLVARGPRLVDYRPRSMLALPGNSPMRARFAAVDAHNHLGRWMSRDGTWMVPDVPAFLQQMDAQNIDTTINLDGRWGDELEQNLDRYDRAHPERFATLCHVDWAELEQRNGTDHLIESLQKSHAAGARGLKVWKDLGLRVRDRAGRFILPDDARLEPLWQAAGEAGLPVVIHTGDPIAFFQPVDTSNERLEELLRNPAFAIPRASPSFERLLGSLESVVAHAPATTFVGAHVGGYPEDLGWVDRMLTTYPNFMVDLAGRMAELGRQPRAARALFLEHEDRILFGSDTFPPSPKDLAIWFRFLETDDEYFSYSSIDPPPQGRWNVSGLGLPDRTLEKIYCENARRVFSLR